MDINVLAPANQLGYGVAGLNFLINLRKLGHRVSYFPIGNPDVPQVYHEALREMIENAKTFDYNAPCLRIWHQHDMAQRVGEGSFNGMPIFELDRFNDVEKHHLNQVDYVLVNSEWARQIVIDQCSQPPEFVKVVPLGVDREIFKPNGYNTGEATIFVNFGKWEIRKGHDILIKAFERAFTESDDVELWMCCENPFFDEAKNKEWADYYHKSSLGSKVRVFSRRETQQDIAQLMNMADCGVFPSRGEGWNLELLEMMSCGKEVIATYHSAHTEFCTTENSYGIVAIDEVEPAYDGVWFHGQGNWAKLEDRHIDQMSTCMKLVHSRKQGGDELFNHHGVETAKQYSWENSTKKLVEALS